jgi:hypothetical protein
VTAPAGAEVGLYVDLVKQVAVGDVIQTQSGRAYSVTEVRVQLRGMHRGRQHLRAVVLERDVDLTGAFVHRIRWYKRGRGRSTP